MLAIHLSHVNLPQFVPYLFLAEITQVKLHLAVIKAFANVKHVDRVAFSHQLLYQMSTKKSWATNHSAFFISLQEADAKGSQSVFLQTVLLWAEKETSKNSGQ